MFEKDRAWIELNKDNFIHNISVLESGLPQGCRMMPCVKANAFGHGAVPISRMLYEHGTRDYCVACISEAVELREAGIEGQILILGYTDPADFSALYEYDLSQTVVDCAYAKVLNAFGRPLRVHVAIDTGMRRIGERSEHVDEIAGLWSLDNLNIDSIYTHLSSADETEGEGREFTLKQIENYDRLVNELHARGITDFRTHVLASSGIANYSEHGYDYIRPGALIYGIEGNPSDDSPRRLGLKHVLELKARISTVRKLYPGDCVSYGRTFRADHEMLCASVGFGYADGMPRELSNRWHALVNGKVCPMIGTICMDFLMLDVCEVPDVHPGTEVVLIGKSGDEAIRACDMALAAGVNTNAVLSQLSHRLGRIIV